MTDAEIKRHVNRIKENKAKADTNQQSWRDILRGYIYRADWSKTDFIQNTLLSETVYKRLMGGKEKKLSLKSIVAICLALKIPSDKAQKIIYACGYTFDNSMIHMPEPVRVLAKNKISRKRGFDTLSFLRVIFASKANFSLYTFSRNL